jgi:hypothetical protein
VLVVAAEHFPNQFQHGADGASGLPFRRSSLFAPDNEDQQL